MINHDKIELTDEECQLYMKEPPEPRDLSEAEVMHRLYELMTAYPGYCTDDPEDRIGLAHLIATHLTTRGKVVLQPWFVFVEQVVSARKLQPVKPRAKRGK